MGILEQPIHQNKRDIPRLQKYAIKKAHSPAEVGIRLLLHLYRGSVKKAILYNQCYTRSAAYWEIAQKLHLRWYLTLYITDTLNSHGFNEYCRQCGKVGTLIHMLWACPNIKSCISHNIFNHRSSNLEQY